MNTKIYFEAFQKDIIKLANSEAGRFLFDIKGNYPIIKVSPNSLHQLVGIENDRAFIKGKFYSGSPEVAIKLLPILEKMQIAKVNSYRAFLHFSGLQRSRDLPTIFLTTFNVGSGDGFVRYSDAAYANARGGSGSGNTVDSSSANTSFSAPGQVLSAGTYYVGHVYLPTDTSSITAPATIVGGGNSVNVWPEGLINNDSDTMCVVATTQASTSTLANTDFTQVGSTDGGHLALSAITSGQINTFTLNGSGDGFLNKTGFTKVGLRSLQDINNTAPIGENDFGGGNGMDTSKNGTPSHRPYLTIIYTLPTTTGGAFLQNFM